MTDQIVKPIEPDNVKPEPHPVLAGDFKDDDGPAFDEYFEAPSHGPQEYGSIPVPAPVAVEPKPTRIISRVIRMTCSETANSDPIMLLNEDVRRKDLIVHVNLVQTNIPRPDQWQFMIGSDKADLYNGAAFNGMTSTVEFGAEWRSDKHTGAVWILCRISPDDPSPLPAQFDVCVWAVTE